MLGLAFEPLTAAGYPPLLDALLPAGGLADAFAVCLTPSGGALTLGGVDPRFAAHGRDPAPFAYTPVVLGPGQKDCDFYRV